MLDEDYSTEEPAAQFGPLSPANEQVKIAIRSILESVGEDPEHDGLKNTPLRMTRQIADFLNDVLHPRGAAVVAEGAHLCSMMRGVRKANARMVTSAVLGGFKSGARTRSEFFEHIRQRDKQ